MGYVAPAPRIIEGFTKNGEQKIKDCISKNNFAHRGEVVNIENGIATLRIHKFKTGKGKPAKDYTVQIDILKTWGNKIVDFENYRIVQNKKIGKE